MSAPEATNSVASSPKFHQDRSAYAAALAGWFASQRPAAGDVSVSGIDIPAATGFSNETVFFAVDWTEAGTSHHQRFVARIEPGTGALFPAQTAACAVSVHVQYRAMEVAGRHGVPMCPLLGYEPDASILGRHRVQRVWPPCPPVQVAGLHVRPHRDPGAESAALFAPLLGGDAVDAPVGFANQRAVVLADRDVKEDRTVIRGLEWFGAGEVARQGVIGG